MDSSPSATLHSDVYTQEAHSHSNTELSSTPSHEVTTDHHNHQLELRDTIVMWCSETSSFLVCTEASRSAESSVTLPAFGEIEKGSGDEMNGKGVERVGGMVDVVRSRKDCDEARSLSECAETPNAVGEYEIESEFPVRGGRHEEGVQKPDKRLKEMRREKQKIGSVWYGERDEENMIEVQGENRREDPWYDLKQREWRKKTWVGVEGWGGLFRGSIGWAVDKWEDR